MPAAVSTRAVTALAVAARVALGGLWLHEGIFKYQAGFGRSDILLVVNSTASNSRVPWFFAPIRGLLRAAPSFFGVLMPLAETALGVALVLGVLTLPVAAISVFQLMTYWSADQLIAQYPAMVLLALVVLLTWRSGLSLSGDRLLLRAAQRSRVGGRLLGRLAPDWENRERTA